MDWLCVRRVLFGLVGSNPLLLLCRDGGICNAAFQAQFLSSIVRLLIRGVGSGFVGMDANGLDWTGWIDIAGLGWADSQAVGRKTRH
ncbi:hypothetical protein BKA61DRAFT_300982 [Leptodontidium sp. MPI-SDFR-AT-0119]|nr:hypothetical protein BKA61DRAFT_300982 [Leptodontidium sp. MPI-SDFR-AT-0119]